MQVYAGVAVVVGEAIDGWRWKKQLQSERWLGDRKHELHLPLRNCERPVCALRHSSASHATEHDNGVDTQCSW